MASLIDKLFAKSKLGKAHLQAQRNAALPVSEGGLGLPPENTAMDRAAAMGAVPYLHGTERLDRFLGGKAPDPRRATSGPMPYGTDSPAIASNYAVGKADTSLRAADEGDVRNYFQVAPKSLGYSGRAPYSVEQSWHHLPPETRADILDKMKRVGYENPDTASGPFTLHPPGADASLSGSHLDYLMKTSARGNPLAALREMWLDGGDLYDRPEALADIYKLAGYPHEVLQNNAPWYQAPGVYTGYAMMQNPIKSDDTAAITDKILPALQEAFAKDRTRLKAWGPDPWAKDARYTPKDWVKTLEEDTAAGRNSYVWTSIPDKVTAELKRLGYDGILDTGGKGGGDGHQVVIPFEPHQVRARSAAFDPKRRFEANDLAAVGALTPAMIPTGGQPQAQPTLIDKLRGAMEQGWDPMGGYARQGLPPAQKVGDVVNMVVDVMPGVGDVKSVAEGLDALQKGDYAGAGLGMLGALPLVGGLGAIKAYHGSPHEFDKFDMSKIGTGEGNQAYGHGLYFAESPKVAETYRTSDAGRNKNFRSVTYDGVQYPTSDPMAYTLHDTLVKGRKYVIDDLERQASRLDKNYPAMAQKLRDKISFVKTVNPDKVKVDGGNLYDVTLAWPDAAREARDPLSPEHFVQLDKPLEKQPQQVKDLVRQGLKDQGFLGPNENGPRQMKAALSSWRLRYGGMSDTALESLLFGRGGLLGGDPEDVAKRLREAGIPGIRYRDAGSRGATGGKKSHNYVVFDDQIPKIDARRK